MKLATLVAAGLLLLDVTVRLVSWAWVARDEVVVKSQLIELQVATQSAISAHVLEEAKGVEAMLSAIEQIKKEISSVHQDISWFRAKAGLPPSSSSTHR